MSGWKGLAVSQIFAIINHCIINSSSNDLHPLRHLVFQQSLKQNILSSLFKGFGWWDFSLQAGTDRCLLTGKNAELALGWKSASSWDQRYRIWFSETKKDEERRDTRWRASLHQEAGFCAPPSSSKVYGSWTDTIDVWNEFSFLWQSWGWSYERQKQSW